MDTCIDVVGSSPFTGNGVSSFIPGVAVKQAVDRKRKKYGAICAANGHGFDAFAFSTFGELGEDVVDFLRRVKRVFLSHAFESRGGEFIFHRVGMTIQRFCQW